MKKLRKEVRIHKTIMINKNTYDYLIKNFGSACLSRVVRVLTDEFVEQHIVKENLLKRVK